MSRPVLYYYVADFEMAGIRHGWMGIVFIGFVAGLFSGMAMMLLAAGSDSTDPRFAMEACGLSVQCAVFAAFALLATYILWRSYRKWLRYIVDSHRLVVAGEEEAT